MWETWGQEGSGYGWKGQSEGSLELWKFPVFDHINISIWIDFSVILITACNCAVISIWKMVFCWKATIAAHKSVTLVLFPKTATVLFWCYRSCIHSVKTILRVLNFGIFFCVSDTQCAALSWGWVNIKDSSQLCNHKRSNPHTAGNCVAELWCWVG